MIVSVTISSGESGRRPTGSRIIAAPLLERGDGFAEAVDLDPYLVAGRDPLRRDDAAQRHEFPGAEGGSAVVHAAGEPRERFERMAEDVRAAAHADVLAVDRH